MVKKYLSLERLADYDELIKTEIKSGDESTLSSAKSYTDTKVSSITSGDVIVKEAEHSTSADSAVNADHSTSSDSATKATQDASGNVITDTYETKVDAQVKYDTIVEAKADWSQNDENSIDYIKNRTHYDNTVIIEYLPATSITSSTSYNATSTREAYSALLNVPHFDESLAGAVYIDFIVNIDGVDYLYKGDYYGLSDVRYNNKLSYKDNFDENGVILFIEWDYRGERYVVYMRNPNETHVVSIRREKTELVQLDEKYIPETIARTMDVNVALENKANKVHNHDDIYETKVDAQSKLDEAKAYADSAATKVKNDLLNGAGGAYDTLKELGDLIDENKDAIEALETIASGKADATHGHAIADVSGLQSALDGKADVSHGTHVTFDSTNKPKMDGTAAFGTSTSVARADHVHPTDTSRASQTALDSHISDAVKHITSTERTNWGSAYTHSTSAHAPSNAQANVIESIKVNGTAQTITSKAVNITVPTKASDIGAAESTHAHAISDITNLQTTLNNAANGIQTNTNSINAHTDRISALETKVGDGFEEITSTEIQNLFK